MSIDPDLPGGSDGPRRAQDPVDPARVQRGADAGFHRAEPRDAPVAGEPRRRRPDGDRNRAWWLWALLAAVLIAIVVFVLATA